jgi:hypothetical protein
VPADRLSPWREQLRFLKSAERELLTLPPGVQDAFLDAFPEVVRHPTRATASLDIGPVRDRAGRWRLKVKGGHRGIYRIVQGQAEFEMFETRDPVYSKLRAFLSSRVK